MVITFLLLPKNQAEPVKHLGQFWISTYPLSGSVFGQRQQPTHICTIGCARPLDDALRISFEEMVYWMEESFKIPGPEAYMLLGQIAEARCTQMVNPKYTYICKVAKKYLGGHA